MKSNKHDHMQPLQAPLLRGYADSYVKLSGSRSIFFAEDFTIQSAAELSALLLYYDHLDPEEPITLYLHSDGGDTAGLMNIYDVMQMVKCPIKTVLMGKCYSAGAVILAAGTYGERYALRSSMVMIHGVQFAFPLPNQQLIESKNHLEFISSHNDCLLKILATHTGHTLEKLKTDCSRELWMDAKGALAYGIIDHIV